MSMTIGAANYLNSTCQNTQSSSVEKQKEPSSEVGKVFP